MMMMTIGTSSTMKSAGMIRNAIGKSIFTGAFCACSSAAARRRFRSSTARFRMIWPVETPIVSPCAMERANMRTPGVSMRPRKFVRASTSVRPMFCSCSVRRTSPASGSLIFVDASRSDCGKLRPASSVTTTRSIRSGQVLLDLLAALARLAVDDEAGGDPAEDPGGDRAEDVDPGGHVADGPEGEPPEREARPP